MSDKLLLPLSDDYSPQWREINAWFRADCLDRTGTITFGDFDYHVLTPIPDDSNTDKTFADLCDARAAHILAGSTRPVLLLWSGGIDSTAALAALIRADKPFFCSLSPWAAQEYPALYRRLWQCQFAKVTPVHLPPRLNSLFEQFNLVTGELGDQMFGSDLMFRGDFRRQLLAPFGEVLPQPVLDATAAQRAKAPIPLKDTADVLWWVNFSLKYQFVQYRMFDSGAEPRSNTYHFFCAADFDRWAISNREANKRWIDSGDARYKQVAKDYIYAQFKDADYRDKKRKQWSLRNLHNRFRPAHQIFYTEGNDE